MILDYIYSVALSTFDITNLIGEITKYQWSFDSALEIGIGTVFWITGVYMFGALFSGADENDG